MQPNQLVQREQQQSRHPTAVQRHPSQHGLHRQRVSSELQAAQAKLQAFTQERDQLLHSMQQQQPQQPQKPQKPQQPRSTLTQQPGPAGGMMPVAQRTERTQHAQDLAVWEQQQEQHRRKQRDKVWSSSLPKKSRHASRRSHGLATGARKQKQPQNNFRAAQSWSGTMLAW